MNQLNAQTAFFWHAFEIACVMTEYIFEICSFFETDRLVTNFIAMILHEIGTAALATPVDIIPKWMAKDSLVHNGRNLNFLVEVLSALESEDKFYAKQVLQKQRL